MLAELLQHWGSEGLDAHLRGLQSTYKRRAQLMHNSAKQVSQVFCVLFCPLVHAGCITPVISHCLHAKPPTLVLELARLHL